MHNTLKYNILCRRGPRRFVVGLFGRACVLVVRGVF